MLRTACLSLMTLTVLVGCSSSKHAITSERVLQPVAIDGAHAEWGTSLRPVPDESGILYGVRNTDDRLYLIVVATGEEAARRIAVGGMTVWFDTEGGQEEVYGIRYPVGLFRSRGEARSRGERGRRGEEGRSDRPGNDPAQREARLRRSFERVAILREGGREHTDYVLGEVPGVRAAAVSQETGFVAELEVPIGEGAFDLAVTPGQAFGMALELAPTLQRRPGGRQGGRPGRGGETGRGGGIPGGLDSRPGTTTESVTHWLFVTLGG